MGNKMKSLAAAVALGFALLFLGPAASTARADQFGPHVSFSGRFPLPHGSVSVNVGHGRHFRNHGYIPRHRFARPFGHGRSFVRHHRPYRLVRVFVRHPYPRWIYQRVYYTPYVGAYCPY